MAGRESRVTFYYAFKWIYHKIKWGRNPSGVIIHHRVQMEIPNLFGVCMNTCKCVAEKKIKTDIIVQVMIYKIFTVCIVYASQMKWVCFWTLMTFVQIFLNNVVKRKCKVKWSNIYRLSCISCLLNKYIFKKSI